MNDIQQRQEAVRQVLAGEKVSSVAKAFGKSRKWVHEWLNRYEQHNGAEGWYAGQSKAPKSAPTKVDIEVEQRVILVRQELLNRNYAQTGAIAIQYEFRNRGWNVPPMWTINRILSRNQLIHIMPSVKTRKEYPTLFVHSHQMDLVGPRYIKGDGRFYSVNLIDTLTHTVHTKAVRCKSSDEILKAIVEFWQTYGMPDALQMDNELSFRGSNRHPRSFGNVIRFALSQGVAPVFIPIKEPWRNGMIEKFNDNYDKRFLRKHTFADFEQLCLLEQDFIAYHNQYHRYSSQQHNTPIEMTKKIGHTTIYKGDIHLQKWIPLTQGSIYFIRFIRSDVKLHLITESFQLKPELKYSYVIAEINIDNQNLIVRQPNNEIVQMFEYCTPVEW